MYRHAPSPTTKKYLYNNLGLLGINSGAGESYWGVIAADCCNLPRKRVADGKCLLFAILAPMKSFYIFAILAPMKSFYIAIPLIVALASPAFAQSARRGEAYRPAQTTSTPVGQPRVGTDPDPNVRFELLRQQNWRKGGS
jgi:hypothetical protein